MIFYFTGTGNSLWIAKTLSEAFDEPAVAVADLLNRGETSFSLKEEEKIFFVYPVHSWGPAVEMMRFVKRLEIKGYHGQPLYSVCSCGDDCGYASRLLSKALKKKGLRLNGAYSVTMPNNYILLPGFDTDSEELATEKLNKAPARLKQIIEAIRRNDASSALYHPGSSAFLKTYLVYPLFTHFAIGRNSFRVTEACISCGLCEKICPTHTIRLIDKKPVWTDQCVQCVACIHRCPVKAIEYGRETVKKGRYRHPNIR